MIVARQLRICFVSYSGVHPALLSFPTRRSSDLARRSGVRQSTGLGRTRSEVRAGNRPRLRRTPRRHDPEGAPDPGGDRKSTRLNSSHLGISYAVFCLKKKTPTKTPLQHSELGHV